MEQQQCAELLSIIGRVYETPNLLEEYWTQVTSLLTELVSTAPEGFEGTAMMICTHINNAANFNDVKVRQFELESGLIKFKTYLQKLNSSESKEHSE